MEVAHDESQRLLAALERWTGVGNSVEERALTALLQGDEPKLLAYVLESLPRIAIADPETLFERAVIMGKMKVANRMIDIGCVCLERLPMAQTLLRLVAANGNVELLLKLLQVPGLEDEGAVMSAVTAGRQETVLALLKHPKGRPTAKNFGPFREAMRLRNWDLCETFMRNPVVREFACESYAQCGLIYLEMVQRKQPVFEFCEDVLVLLRKFMNLPEENGARILAFALAEDLVIDIIADGNELCDQAEFEILDFHDLLQVERNHA